MALLESKRAELLREQRELARQREIAAAALKNITQKRNQLSQSSSDSRRKSLIREVNREEERYGRVERRIASIERRITALQKEVSAHEARLSKQSNLETRRARSADQQAARDRDRRVAALEQATFDRLRRQVASDSVEKEFDCSILYVKEDEDLARSLARKLEGRRTSVWWEDTELKLGLSLQSQLNKAIDRSRFGVILVTPAVLAGRYWTERELGALLTSARRVVPILDRVEFSELQNWSPILADTAGLSTSLHGLDELANRLAEVAHA